jgi:long-chain acyl-CoA synthetase
MNRKISGSYTPIAPGRSAADFERALLEVHDVMASLTYPAFLHRTALRVPDKAAIVCGERVLSYRDFFTEIAGLAGYLASKEGVGAGDHVALLLENTERYQAWYLAVLALGAVAVPLNTKLTAREIAYQIGNSGATTVVSQTRFGAVLAEREISWIDGDAVVTEDHAPIDIAAQATQPGAPAAIYYTSGTTGNPKGVMHTHRSLIAATIQAPGAWEYDDPEAITLAMTPLFHIANHTWFLPVLALGGTMVIDVFRSDDVLDLIARQRVTHVFAVPTMLLLMAQRHQQSREDLSCVKTVAFGAAAMPPEKLADVQRMFPKAGLVHGMGQTESCGTIVTLPSPLAFAKAGSVGLPINGADTRVVDDADRDVLTKVVGELITRGPNVAAGYHEQPEATAAAFGGGWLRTGDLGYLDEEGYLFLVDRKKDMIIRGGENIYSSEVENVLYMHASVLQAGVVAAPSELFGEEVFAFVVCRDGVPVDSAAHEQTLLEHCRANIASFKVPRGIAFIEAFPQTATGKLQKHMLRTMLPEAPR